MLRGFYGSMCLCSGECSNRQVWLIIFPLFIFQLSGERDLTDYSTIHTHHVSSQVTSYDHFFTPAVPWRLASTRNHGSHWPRASPPKIRRRRRRQRRHSLVTEKETRRLFSLVGRAGSIVVARYNRRPLSWRRSASRVSPTLHKTPSPSPVTHKSQCQRQNYGSPRLLLPAPHRQPHHPGQSERLWFLAASPRRPRLPRSRERRRLITLSPTAAQHRRRRRRVRAPLRDGSCSPQPRRLPGRRRHGTADGVISPHHNPETVHDDDDEDGRHSQRGWTGGGGGNAGWFIGPGPAAAVRRGSHQHPAAPGNSAEQKTADRWGCERRLGHDGGQSGVRVPWRWGWGGAQWPGLVASRRCGDGDHGRRRWRDSSCRGGNLTVELESGGRLKQQQSRVESLVLGMAPWVPSSNAASSEHSDGPGGSLGSTESSSGSRRKTKRKQVYPKQQQTGEEEDAGGELDSGRGDGGERKQGHQSPSSREKDVMRKEFSMMREKIDVLEERYVVFFFNW